MWIGAGGGEIGERIGESGLKVALWASEGCGNDLAISVQDSRGQRELEDAEPSTQGRRKQFDSGSRYFVAIGEGEAKIVREEAAAGSVF